MKNEYAESAAYFKRATAGHQVTVLHEDGLYRHLRFQTPGNGSSYGYDLITWPYNLVIRGGWTFTFSIDATEDMLDLFRRTSFPGKINPGYWQEKVTAGRDQIESFSEELLKKEIEDTVQQWEQDSPATGLREAVQEHFFGEWPEYNLEYREEANRALYDFSFTPKNAKPGDSPYVFDDWSEWRLTEFSPGFLWSCHAIRHGIELYDAARKTEAVAS
ncbi:hypothetical protein GCM10010275_19540 [Streptomyces litmocidini]|uniref:hypothetical protein n=1 Tax=Streptomyces litmocidini TaxID=67318 RepID=UPI00167E5309|nr:hypothetical protein [Streptomyces litmocidini]GGU84575.1 hypothetical protein GCM10010275_19540 [Streptomyces litmocidini]